MLSHRGRLHDCTSLSSWNVRAPGRTTCVSMALWSGQSWSMPVQFGTQVSLPCRRRHWSHCSAERCTSTKMTTIPYRWFETGLTRCMESRHKQLTERFFKRSVLPETSCLHYLLPDKRDVSITGRLHHARTLEPLKSRTVKFRHFLYNTPWTIISRPLINCWRCSLIYFCIVVFLFPDFCMCITTA